MLFMTVKGKTAREKTTEMYVSITKVNACVCIIHSPTSIFRRIQLHLPAY